MEIKACPRCGSLKIFQGTMSQGVLTGITSKDVCRNCGYQGAPIIFENEENYKNFLNEIPKNQQEFNQLTSEKKENISNPPFGILILISYLIFQGFLSLILYYYLLYSKIFSFVWIYFISIFLLEAIILPYGLYKGKKWAWNMGGMLFALSIPIGLIFLYYITRPKIKSYFEK